MNEIELTTFDNFILDFKISRFDNSANCVAVLTHDKIIIGLITNDQHFSWNLLKEIKLDNGVSTLAFSPISRTVLLPLCVQLSYADKNGVYSFILSENGDEITKTILMDDIDVSAMNYNDDGTRIALTGADKRCRILSYQSECLSECDSMVNDAVSEGSYDQCCVPLTSEGQCVLWHNVKQNYVVVAEIGGVIRLLSCVSGINGDNNGGQDTFVCEYVINIGLRLPAPLSDMDIIYNSDQCSHDFVVATSAGLFLFALDKPLLSLEKLNVTGCSVLGYSRVRMSASWGQGSLLATVSANGRVAVTDVCGSRVIESPIGDCVALDWHKSRPMLLAATASCKLMAVEFIG